MKKTIKVFGIVALVAVIGFSMAACGGDEGGSDKELSGTVTAVEHKNLQGVLEGFAEIDFNAPSDVNFTTNIPGEENFSGSASMNEYNTPGITIGQVYTWKATSSKPIKTDTNHDPNNGLVRIVYDY